MLTGLTLISGTPRKNGKISILLEADKTTDNMRSLVELYEKPLSLAADSDLPQLPADQITELDLADLIQMTDRLFSKLIKLKYPKTGVEPQMLTFPNKQSANDYTDNHIVAPDEYKLPNENKIRRQIENLGHQHNITGVREWQE